MTFTTITSKKIITNELIFNKDNYKINTNNTTITITGFKTNDIYYIIPDTMTINEKQYTITDIDITFPIIDNNIYYYLYIPDTVNSITLNTESNNYNIILDVPYKNITFNITNVNVICQIIREYTTTLINNYKILSNVVNFTSFDNSYFIISDHYVYNNIDTYSKYIPYEYYKYYSALSLIRYKNYYKNLNVVYIKKCDLIDETEITTLLNTSLLINDRRLEGFILKSTNDKIIISKYNDTTNTSINNILINNIKLSSVGYDHICYYNNNKVYYNNKDVIELNDVLFLTTHRYNNINSIYVYFKYTQIDSSGDETIQYMTRKYDVIQDNYVVLVNNYIFYDNLTIKDMISYKQYGIIMAVIDNSNIVIYYSVDNTIMSNQILHDIPYTITDNNNIYTANNITMSTTNDNLIMMIEYLYNSNKIYKHYKFNTYKRDELLMKI